MKQSYQELETDLHTHIAAKDIEGVITTLRRLLKQHDRARFLFQKKPEKPLQGVISGALNGLMATDYENHTIISILLSANLGRVPFEHKAEQVQQDLESRKIALKVTQRQNTSVIKAASRKSQDQNVILLGQAS